MAAKTGNTQRIIHLLELGYTGRGREIAKRLRINKSSASSALHLLEKKGVVEKIPNTYPAVFRAIDAETTVNSKKNAGFGYRVMLFSDKTILSFPGPVEISSVGDQVIVTQKR